MVKSTFDLEKRLIAQGYHIIIGIDEAGRGPLAGPVIASAVALRNFQFPISNLQSSSNNLILNDKNWDLVRDSKTLSHKQRENLFDFIHEHFYVGVGICDHETIDRMNILEATYLAMKKAVTELNRTLKRFDLSRPQRPKEVEPRVVILLDGNKPIPNISHEQKVIVNGDKTVKSISAASIVAKVTRDRMMLGMHEKYPEYNFAQHKGYGTKAHMAALQKKGPCAIHRRSFAPVRELVRVFGQK
jgi:ribonuclease HII